MNSPEVKKIRSFNRFYTKVTGLLDQYLLNSEFTLPEVRVMYEIHHHNKITSKEISEILGIDKGYLSRTILEFEKKGIIKKETHQYDKRALVISLTSKGAKEFMKINKATEMQISKLLSKLEKEEIRNLTSCMEQIQHILNKTLK